MHGVEGYLGAAVQLTALREKAALASTRGDVRFVFVHALNPHGFAWSRRVNEDNVDLNRNFLIEGERYSGSPVGYAALDGMLNPQRPPSWRTPFYPQALWAVARLGMPALKQSIAAGQYDYPQGLFFGGAGPSRTKQCLAQHLPQWLGSCSSVVHIDFHSGLGAWGTYKLLLDFPISTAQREWLTRAFGLAHVVESTSARMDYTTRGGLGQWLARTQAPRSYLTLTAEFGTYPVLRVLAGLRAENQAHHWSTPEANETRGARERLRELFCPADPAWRAQVLALGVALVHRAALALAVGDPAG
jgi:hypothetical protein